MKDKKHWNSGLFIAAGTAAAVALLVFMLGMKVLKANVGAATRSGTAAEESSAAGSSFTESENDSSSASSSNLEGEAESSDYMPDASLYAQYDGRRQVTATPTPSPSPSPTPLPTATPTPTPVPQNDAEFVASALSGKSGLAFYTTTAGGPWHTDVTLLSDASFSGEYSRTAAERTSAYTSVVSQCTFTGWMQDVSSTADGVYRMTVILTAQTPTGSENNSGGILYKYTLPEGISHGDTVYLFAPGAAASEVPEACRTSLSSMGITIGTTTVGRYVLYDESTQTAFAVYGG